jgi:hypothetical protein
MLPQKFSPATTVNLPAPAGLGPPDGVVDADALAAAFDEEDELPPQPDRSGSRSATTASANTVRRIGTVFMSISVSSMKSKLAVAAVPACRLP